MSKLKVTIFNSLNLVNKRRLQNKPHNNPKLFYLYAFTTIWNVLQELNPFSKKQEDKITRYFTNQSIPELIALSDQLYNQENFIEVYEILNRLKFAQDAEIQWRIARALFRLSLEKSKNITEEIRRDMIDEAYDILVNAESNGKHLANYHKWLAIILNAKHGVLDLEHRVKSYPLVKHHLTEASKMNPNDFAVQYMLGKWCLELCELNWFQKIIAKFLLTAEAPESTYQEAYEHLANAEEIKPKGNLKNMFLLGKACLRLKQYYRAKYYFNLVIHMQAQNNSESCCISQAKGFIKMLDRFDLGRNVLYYEKFFDFVD